MYERSYFNQIFLNLFNILNVFLNYYWNIKNFK